jgi:hypothetical protein
MVSPPSGADARGIVAQHQARQGSAFAKPISGCATSDGGFREGRRPTYWLEAIVMAN